MKGKERATLRAEAHHLNAIVHVGHQGITDRVIQTLDDALRTRELVKVDVSKNLDATVKATAGMLADAAHAEVIQVIGRKVTLYRENPDLEWKGDTPPWR
jgi:RNA-binding protein